MKIVRQFKPVRGKLAKQHSECFKREAKTLQKALWEEFQHPFHIWRKDEKTLVSWELGPHRLTVWLFILTRFPQLATEAVMASILRYGFQMIGDDTSFPIPSFLNRHDLFNANVEDIAYLAALGADMEEEGEDGTPLQTAVMLGDDLHAVALAEAGADFSAYGPEWMKRAPNGGLPAFLAFLEKRHLAAIASEGQSGDRRCQRL